MIDRIKFPSDDDVMISWLPLFHDMGMVGFLTVPMQYRRRDRSASRRWTSCTAPLLWAELIGKYRGTVTAAPNFAYSLLARRLAQAEDGVVDLSTCAACSTAPNRSTPTRCSRSRRRAHDSGSTRGARADVRDGRDDPRGLAARPGARAWCSTWSTPDLLEAGGLAVPTDAGPMPAGSRRWATLVTDLEGRVVDADGRVLPRRAASASSSCAGASVTPGYLTVDGFVPAQDADGWLDTGDVGYFTEDGLWWCAAGQGRDHHGRAQHLPDRYRAGRGTRRGCGPATRSRCGSMPGEKRESFAVVVETNDYEDPDEVERIEHEVVHAVFWRSACGRARSRCSGRARIPKTSSGKLRRANYARAALASAARR